MTREPGIEKLLNDARDVGIRAVEGKPATKTYLALAASAARQTVLMQAEAGMWKEWCVTCANDIRAVKCEFILNDPTLLAIRREPISIKWDWKETPLRHLATT